MWPGTFDPVLGDPLADLDEPFLVRLGPDPRQRHDRPRMRLARVTLDVDGAGGDVVRDDLADVPVGTASHPGRACFWAGSYTSRVQIEILGRERVTPRLLALHLLVERSSTGSSRPIGIRLVDELLGREVHQPMEVPPHRLVLAPMPARAAVPAASEHGRLSVARRRLPGTIVRIGQTVGQRLDAGHRLGQSAGRGVSRGAGRGTSIPVAISSSRRLSSQSRSRWFDTTSSRL